MYREAHKVQDRGRRKAIQNIKERKRQSCSEDKGLTETEKLPTEG